MQSWLLEKAARCYERADLLDEAARVWNRLERPDEASRLHERLGDWQRAADAAVRGEAWGRAARCYARIELWEEAARCHLEADEPLDAAWIYAHHLELHAHALAALEHLASSARAADELAAEIVRARCDLGRGHAADALRRLRGVPAGLRKIPPGRASWRLEQWSVRVAEKLGRPDLTASIFAAATAAGSKDAAERWAAWALRVFGQAPGGLVSPPTDPTTTPSVEDSTR